MAQPTMNGPYAGLQRIETVEQLEAMLSDPSPGAVETLRRLDGDLIILGAGGKIGPSLARMARRAGDEGGLRRRVIAVSRFSSEEAERDLQAHGVETIRCDLLDPAALKRLPDAPNVVFMAGMKFGSTGTEALTWAMNSFLPGMVCRKWSRSRIVAFSTGCVYGLAPVAGGGSLETDPPEPQGEYSISCLGRERIFEYFSRRLGIPQAFIRLNYACEMRYGALADLARQVWTGEAIDLTMGHFNVIWQGDAAAMALQAFGRVSSPPFIVNVTGPELLSVRRVCEQFAALMGKPVRFLGAEAPDAFLSDAQLSHRLFGPPRVSVQQMIHWVADWVRRGGASLGKPTHFQVRDGRY